jgi:AAA15 family ATPase/GTPase
MDLDLLRRDEIWFTEKNPDSETSVYPLSDFSIRTDLKVSKGYLQGRFGAIPFLGDIDRLVEGAVRDVEATR